MPSSRQIKKSGVIDLRIGRSAIAKTLGLGQLKRKADARKSNGKSNGRSKTAKP